MTASEKRRVRLADVRPDPNNPRKDFGDIASLAAAIEATGGEPVNPVVVVRDGSVYRIVDGERRLRAMRRLHGRDDAFECDALVFDDVSDAHAMVAMLATDDKQLLSDEERARGVQEMLALGVDEEVVAKASRVERSKLASVRRMRPYVPDGTQVTIDQLVAADALEDDLDRETVLSSGADWRQVARRIERDRARERASEEVAAAARSAGVGIVDSVPDGHRYLLMVTEASQVAGLPDGTVLVDRGTGEWWAYRPGSEDAARAEARRRVDESAAAVAASVARMAEYLGGLLERPDCAALAPLRADCADSRDLSDDQGIADALLPDLLAAPVSAFEMAAHAHGLLLRVARRGGLLGWDGEPSEWACGPYLDACGLVRRCGWEPTAEDRELMAVAAATEVDEERRDEDDEG